MARNVYDPVLPCGLLFVVALVLCGGVGVVNVATVVLTLGPYGVAVGVGISFGIEDGSAGGANAALVTRIDNVWNPYLTVIRLPMALLGHPFLLRLCRLARVGFALSCLCGRQALTLAVVRLGVSDNGGCFLGRSVSPLAAELLPFWDFVVFASFLNDLLSVGFSMASDP